MRNGAFPDDFIVTVRSLRAHRGVWCPTVDRGGGGLLSASQRRKRADGDLLVEEISVAQVYLFCETLYKRLS